MALGNIKGISVANKESRINFLKEIEKTPNVEKLVENNRGFYLKVSNPLISLVPDRSNVKSPVPVPVVLNNNVVGDIHYDENIVLFQEPSAFFHTVVEQFPKILELKKNNENFKVLLIQSRRSLQEKIAQRVDHHVSSFFKDNGIDYIVLHTDPSNMHKTISAKSVYLFYICEYGINDPWGKSIVCPAKLYKSYLSFESCIYDIPWVYNHKLGSAFRFDSLREYFKEIVEDPIPGKKIFLARNYHVYGRGWNNYELLYDYLHSKGFEIFYLENHSFNNQIKICSSAEYIISMVGSSLVVPMLATNNTKIISIHTSTMEEYGVYHWQSGRNDGIIKSIYLDEDSNDIINYLETSSNYLIREAIDL
jgi:hypothetical protein